MYYLYYTTNIKNCKVYLYNIKRGGRSGTLTCRKYDICSSSEKFFLSIYILYTLMMFTILNKGVDKHVAFVV